MSKNKDPSVNALSVSHMKRFYIWSLNLEFLREIVSPVFTQHSWTCWSLCPFESHFLFTDHLHEKLLWLPSAADLLHNLKPPAVTIFKKQLYYTVNVMSLLDSESPTSLMILQRNWFYNGYHIFCRTTW